MTARDNISAIEPGSIPYGDRQGLEAGLSQLGAGAGPQAGGPTSSAQPVPTGGDPLGALLSGQLGAPDAPVTSGLSVGSGPGPAEDDPLNSDTARKLRLIATQAKTPALRSVALQMLKRLGPRAKV